jgi:(1->4)-alpha-D-glucan 1-alpha-D-glucosylmutase
VAEPQRGPVSTYRLQLRAGFGFAEAGELADYLAALGVTHVYLPPILQAAPGSAHGYDITDHSQISADLGGEAAFRAMAQKFRDHGLRMILDIVPNHMTIPVPESLNAQLWSVLREGQASPYAHWFDIDWAAQQGRFLLPILAGPAEECLGDFTLDFTLDKSGEPVLRYFDHVLPLRDGTADLPLPELLKAQHYRLADWRIADAELNWRRFFAVTSLIAVRVEDPDVFAATHWLPVSLLAEGLIDGLRVDHPDGLADPHGYLRRLYEATSGAWVVVEKILEHAEELPASWRCAGTTGYDALGLVEGLFIDPAGAAPLTEEYTRFTGGPTRFAEVAEAAKREVATQMFPAEVSRLIRLLVRIDEPALAAFSSVELHAVLVEMLAGFPVYRAYVSPGEPLPEASAAAMAVAATSARRHLPPHLHPAVEALHAILLVQPPATHPSTTHPRTRAVLAPTPTAPVTSPAAPAPAPGVPEARGAWGEVVVRFQQTTGPVLAKGVEDTAFYRWSRLVALNEVGGDPDRFGVSPAEFHAAAQRLARDWPATLTTLSTHDTKRHEDVRARIAVLAESPQEWSAAVQGWHTTAARLGAGSAGTAGQGTGQGPGSSALGAGGPGAGGQQTPIPASASALDPDFEYLIWQTLVGAWPIEGERLHAYLTKAMREANTRTSWSALDASYEAAVLDFADEVLSDPELNARVARFVAAIAPDARANSLGAKLVQLTMPGVADVYQGCELVELALVDPDNRRPVDFGRRRRLLAALDASAQPDAVGLNAEKLLVTSRALRLRRDHPDWFGGSYAPLAAEGPAAEHAVAFLRGGNAVTVVTRLPAALRRREGWGETVLPLPDADWLDVLTGSRHHGTRPLLSDLTRHLPVALLIPDR